MTQRRLTIIILVLSVLFAILNVAHGAPKNNKQVVPTPTAMLYDVNSDRVLYEINANFTISIASMTKILTVLTVLRANQDLNEVIVVKGREGSPRIRSGMRMTRIDLVELTLVSSDNLAARTLMEHYPGGYNQGIDAANKIAQDLGATNTRIVEPTGLLADNRSTVMDLVKLTIEASKHELFTRFANRERSEIQAEQVSKAKRIYQWIRGNNTNPFVHEPGQIQILSAKTGLTSAAGWCLTMMFSYNGSKYVMVTAGNRTKQDRKKVADMLIEKITNYEYRIKITDPDYRLEH